MGELVLLLPISQVAMEKRGPEKLRNVPDTRLNIPDRAAIASSLDLWAEDTQRHLETTASTLPRSEQPCEPTMDPPPRPDDSPTDALPG